MNTETALEALVRRRDNGGSSYAEYATGLNVLGVADPTTNIVETYEIGTPIDRPADIGGPVETPDATT